MKKILAIQSRKSPERQRAEQEAYERAAGDVAQFMFISTLDIEQSWDTPAEIVRGYNGVIIGGSSDFFWHDLVQGKDYVGPVREVLGRVKLLLEYLVERQIPTLGICFGHQLIAEVFGGAVSHDDSQKKAGTHGVVVTELGEKDALLGSLAPAFDAQYAHKNSVTRPPFGSVTLAEGPACRFAALRYGSMCYTFQFHPEVVAQDFLSQPESLAVYLKEGERVVDIVRETPVANSLLKAFVERVAAPDA